MELVLEIIIDTHTPIIELHFPYAEIDGRELSAAQPRQNRGFGHRPSG